MDATVVHVAKFALSPEPPAPPPFPVCGATQDLVLDVITQLWIDLRNRRQTRLELIQVLGKEIESK